MSALKNFLGSLWSRPGPIVAETGAAGELLVAKTRLWVAAGLWLIPIINLVFFPIDVKESIVGVSLTSAILLLSTFAYLLVSRGYNAPWLSFATSSFDVTLVSAALGVFLIINQPHTAVNSKVVFEGYFLAIAGTGLRYDKRVCITVGLLAFAEYLAIVTYASLHWDLNSPAFAPYQYGVFSWIPEISRLVILLAAAGITLAAVARGQKLLLMATSDPLTGLLNRGSVDDRFAVELSRARRYEKPLSIAVIDADRFKMLNDTYGHLAGDLILRELARVLHDSFRLSDTAGRYGGEEFVVILPETEIETARRKLESLRQTVAETPISLPGRGEKIQLTVSAGLASFPEDGQNAAELFAVADARMFQAKRDGRNRVIAGTTAVVS